MFLPTERVSESLTAQEVIAHSRSALGMDIWRGDSPREKGSVDLLSFLNTHRNEEEYGVGDCMGSHSDSTSRDVRAEVTC